MKRWDMDRQGDRQYELFTDCWQHHGSHEHLTRTSSQGWQEAKSYRTSSCVSNQAGRSYYQHADSVRFIPYFCKQWIHYRYIDQDTGANGSFVFTSRRPRSKRQAYHNWVQTRSNQGAGRSSYANGRTPRHDDPRDSQHS